jgi:hypothetical protein
MRVCCATRRSRVLRDARAEVAERSAAELRDDTFLQVGRLSPHTARVRSLVDSQIPFIPLQCSLLVARLRCIRSRDHYVAFGRATARWRVN